MRAPAVAATALALFAGCDLSAGDHKRSGGAERPKPSARADGRSLHSPAGRLIRDWLMALERGDYGQAATFFARGAIVDQGRPFRLKDAVEARFFNATLPCRADLIALRDAGAAKVLATFTLRAGPGGPCDGLVRVRYTIKRGKFTEWRQLPGPAPGSSRTA